MALFTNRNDEITSGDLYGFGSERLVIQTEAVYKNILTHFFSAKKIFRLGIPELDNFKNSENAERLFIERGFQYQERRFPCIIINANGAEEKKLYNGSDNFSIISTWESPDGKLFGQEMYTDARNVSIQLTIVTHTRQTTQRISEMINRALGHYYRWHYHYRGNDESLFSIVPVIGQIKTSKVVSVEEASNNFLYACTVDITAYAETSFYDNVENSMLYTLSLLTEISDKSGVLATVNL